jgi:hypothetical protein
LFLVRANAASTGISRGTGLFAWSTDRLAAVPEVLQ